MSGFSSKFRHIYGEAAKARDQFGDIKNPLTSGESQYIKANAKFLGYGKSAGGAPLYVRLLSAVGRTKANSPYLAVHKGRLTDFDFHPFIPTIVATGADDCRVNITKFPAEGLTQNITKAEIEIKGHKKKISLIKFNPAANNIIASASYDRTVKVFNIENAATLSSFDAFSDNVYSIAWNKDGSMLGATSKDKCLRVFDPRQGADAAILLKAAFGGIKSTKCFFVNAFGWVGSTGFSKSAKRELKIWDLRNIEKPIYNQGLDAQASVLIPHVDNDLNVLYLAGKGDNSVSYYELRSDDKVVHYLSLYRDGVPQKGGGWVFKRGLDVMKCEVQRFLKLTKDTIIPISFIVPRKSGGDIFQEDIYPDCPAQKPALTADEWSEGKNEDPIQMSMDPEDRKEDGFGGDDIEFKSKQTYDEVVAENVELRRKVKQLQDEIDQLKGNQGGGDDENKQEDVGDDDVDVDGDDGGDEQGGE